MGTALWGQKWMPETWGRLLSFSSKHAPATRFRTLLKERFVFIEGRKGLMVFKDQCNLPAWSLGSYRQAVPAGGFGNRFQLWGGGKLRVYGYLLYFSFALSLSLHLSPLSSFLLSFQMVILGNLAFLDMASSLILNCSVPYHEFFKKCFASSR